MKFVTFVLFLAFATSSFAAEPLVVRNFDQPAWDKTHGIDLAEDLRIGGKDQEDVVFGTMVHITADSKGQIIVADYAQNTIEKFAADGHLIGPIGRGGDGPGEYRFVVAISVDPKDNLYVAGSNRVRVYDSSDNTSRIFVTHPATTCVRYAAYRTEACSWPNTTVPPGPYYRSTSTTSTSVISAMHSSPVARTQRK